MFMYLKSKGQAWKYKDQEIILKDQAYLEKNTMSH